MSNDMMRSIRAVGGGLVIATMMGGCGALDDLIGVDAVDRIVGETLEVPSNAGVLMAGVVGDFECALANYIQAAGTTADEFLVTDGLTAQELVDRRTFEPRGLGAAWSVSTCSARSEGVPGVYRPLSTARWQADNLLRLLDSWSDQQVPDRTFLIAKSAAYAGYSFLLLGESMCQAAFDLGPAVEPPQMFADAEARFTRAIDAATQAGSAEFLNMALVGRARARLDLGRKADAAADAALVPDGFVKNAGYSLASPRRQNVVHVDGLSNLYSVEPTYREVTFQGVADPRFKVVNTGRVVAGVNLTVWSQTKYPARESPIPIARWAEAQLIVAEAAIEAGNLQTAVDIINELHDRAGIPPFASTDPAEVTAQLMYERRAELFLEGHRLGDMLRYNVPLVPAPGTPYHAGGTYGDARCYPLPGIEMDNNPNAR